MTKRTTLDLAGIAQPEFCHFTYSLLPPGEYDCRVVMRNLGTGETAIARESALVPEASGAALVLLPPLLLRPGADVHYFGVQKRGGAEADAGTTFLTTLFPFDTREFSPLIGELEGGAQKAHAMVVCAFEDVQESGLEFMFSSRAPSSRRRDIPGRPEKRAVWRSWPRSISRLWGPAPMS